MVKPTWQTEARHSKAAMAGLRMRTMAVVVCCCSRQQWEADLSLPDRPGGVRLSEKNSGKRIEGAAGRGPVLIGPPSKRAVGQIPWFRVFAIFPVVGVAWSVMTCFANAR